MGELLQFDVDAVLQCTECGCQAWTIHLDQSGDAAAFVCYECELTIDFTDVEETGIFLELPTYGGEQGAPTETI